MASSPADVILGSGSAVPDDVRPPKGVYPTDEEIAERAYEMFLARVSSTFGVADYWTAAQTELLERAAARAIGAAANSRDRRRRNG